MADGITLELNWKEMNALTEKLQTMGDKVIDRTIRAVVSQTMTPVVSKARSIVKSSHAGGSGLLAKSMGKKVKTYKRAGSIVAVAGARKGFKKRVVRNSYTGYVGGEGRFSDPIYYSHLVHNGANVRLGGWVAKRFGLQGTRRFQGSKFLDKSFASSKSKMIAKMASAFKKKVEKEWDKKG